MENEKNIEKIDNEIEPNKPDTEEIPEIEEKIESPETEIETKKGGSFLKELYEWTQAIVVAVVLALVINQFVFSVVEVQGSSMEPTLLNKERLVVFKTLYKPKNKDIVIVKSDALGKYIVKRVIATEGQIIDINKETGQVYVDGTLQEEAYVNKDANFYVGEMNDYPLEVEDDHVFVMGDNRGHSLDSRALGLIDNDELIGKAVFRIWPFNKFGGLYKNLE